MWTLIITIATGWGQGGNGNTSALASVPGFATARACTSAGDQWVQEQRRRNPNKWNFNAVCVEVRK